MGLTKTNPVIGIVDSGYGFAGSATTGCDRVIAAQGFSYDQGIVLTPSSVDRLGHGSALLEVIATQAPAASFAIAQIFHERLSTTPAQVAAAIDWLVEQHVDLINLSLGLRNDREVLRVACEKAIAAGVIICASSPAKGDPVYPSAYPGVLRMTGDARCENVTQLSCLKTQYADFGGYVKAANGVIGASAGCAQMTGHIGRYLSEGGRAEATLIDQWLQRQASYFGVEVRFPKASANVKHSEAE
ncbi:S8 family serine peptidase [Amphritea sp. 1_MG-2023]|uniref:subtilisin-like serine protease QhpE n=1 Tax=Amphritea sp. 1_MG-2023 TaxID=3062670 RepID=UPI0026E3B1CF|nr:S8 family serine peptidase [Amphritea sp. 1_MG-2023]MDO6561876.1 S8 family serine peptidase [Amphritea sp. 1_MG-2023]